MKKIIILIILTLTTIQSFSQSSCDVISVTPNPGLHKFYSPDSSRYLVNIQDADSVYQVYVGNTGDTNLICISDFYSTGNCCGLFRHWKTRNKVMPQWDPSGEFIICGVEKEFYNELLYVPYNLLLGWIHSGIWVDIWAAKPDGTQWYQLYSCDGGMVGPAFTASGTKCAFSEAQSGSDLTVDIFGVWKLQYCDYSVTNGTPALTNITDITPAGSRWNEPGNFSPVNDSLLLISADIGMLNAEGQDQFILNVVNGNIVNLNNSPMIWDEHGVFSPDGSKVLFMSSYPYQADTNSYHTLSLKTEFMLMNTDGTGLQQLTHFCDTAYYPVHPGIAATGSWRSDGARIYAQSLVFPHYNNWIIDFYGNCGNVTATTSINKPESENTDFSIYPNPTSEILNVSFPDKLNIQQLQIFNSMGILLKEISVNQTQQIDVSDLPAGLYIVQYKNHPELSGKFIKQ